MEEEESESEREKFSLHLYLERNLRLMLHDMGESKKKCIYI
jgi:hypothetical protein